MWLDTTGLDPSKSGIPEKLHSWAIDATGITQVAANIDKGIAYYKKKFKH